VTAADVAVVIPNYQGESLLPDTLLALERAVDGRRRGSRSSCATTPAATAASRSCAGASLGAAAVPRDERRLRRGLQHGGRGGRARR
jgi:hypothetical protein